MNWLIQSSRALILWKVQQPLATKFQSLIGCSELLLEAPYSLPY